MSRLNSGAEIFRRLDTFQVFRQVGSTQTTLAAAVTASQATVNLTSGTGFTANDAIAVLGSNGTELNSITAVTPTTAVPLLYPAVVANPSGAIVYRMAATNLAHISRESVRFSGSVPRTPIFSALAASPLTYVSGYGEMQANVDLLGFNGLNLQTMFGVPEGEIGTGASSAPWAAAILGSNIGTQGIQCVRATGTRVDGQNIIVDFNDCYIEPAGEVDLARDTQTVLPLLLKFTSLVIRRFT